LRVAEYDRYVAGSANQTIFSCKVPIWTNTSDPLMAGLSIPSAYHISFHIFSQSQVDTILLRQFTKIDRIEMGKEVVFDDFRETAASRFDHQRSFGGINARFELPNDRFESSYVRQSRAFYMDKAENYYPGMFQNLVLPAFDVRWGSASLKREVESFRWKLVERLRYERRLRPDEFLRLSLAHTRSEVFSPHVVRALDSSTHLS
jgi:hypothetical protein